MEHGTVTDASLWGQIQQLRDTKQHQHQALFFFLRNKHQALF
jgi:hypothetical protein